jgi:heme oxygenase
MRFVAMRLHTKDQAPKEGGREAAKQPFQQWQPTREGYLRFLVESKTVYDALEQIMQRADHPEYARFQNTGLERSAPLEHDIQDLATSYSLQVPQPAEDGPGRAYAKLLHELAQEEPEVFICHFYNTYFAHTAGGRMIGTKVASMILDRKQLQFYQYQGDVKELLSKVRDSINEVAEGWSREQKDKCLNETEKAFQYSGGLLQCITQQQ